VVVITAYEHLLATATFTTSTSEMTCVIWPLLSEGVKDTSLKAKDSTLKAEAKDFKIVLEDEDWSSRTPTLVNIELNVLVKRRILYTFTQ